ncbi:anti-sigma-28 factor, FlgM [Desulfofarcimen acetoxidans DSM 771]|uniref:Negative regulator of flagellin synthesis n=1 Tax=Desulfofarcimen acetoxidans (strain ATCC 49208 / DSM 771 / KCTC 5769 / VKM B-1644 / 5575) TaxID=485916 RepID=C8W1E4_DESAS|nr:flagellar biosynthesis anti-sigma factor FlgM [Desulfofarcimen acetoxidans]ACV61589.1 anti-sigma-28 factor, FlgM [Desulfofarcimen acetoxidans DSM 771]
MKISQNGFNPIKAYTSLVKEKDKIKQPATGNVQADKLEISSQAKEIQMVRSKIAELPSVREDLVAELKQRIQDGTYKSSGEKIADGIIEERLLDKQV